MWKEPLRDGLARVTEQRKRLEVEAETARAGPPRGGGHWTAGESWAEPQSAQSRRERRAIASRLGGGGSSSRRVPARAGGCEPVAVQRHSQHLALAADRAEQHVDPGEGEHAFKPGLGRRRSLCLERLRVVWLRGFDGEVEPIAFEQLTNPGQGVGADMMTRAKAVVPDFVEPLRQHVQQEASQELDRGERAPAAVLGGERHAARVHREDARIGEAHAMGVTAEVADNVLQNILPTMLSPRIW